MLVRPLQRLSPAVLHQSLHQHESVRSTTTRVPVLCSESCLRGRLGRIGGRTLGRASCSGIRRIAVASFNRESAG
eukprot:344072-Rhodomonas_salina.1